MNPNHINYTFTFNKTDTKLFGKILSRLNEDDYEIVEPIADYVEEGKRQYEPQVRTVMNVDPEACSMFRFGMKHLIIRRARTEEEEEAERKQREENTIRINVRIPQNPNSGSGTT